MNLPETDLKTLQELEDTIRKAVKKINGTKENDICRYLPIPNGGYMHHFTMRKMKTEEPLALSALIDRYINKVERPTSVAPKPRAARGSRKRRGGINFSRSELEKLIDIANRLGEDEIINKLSPRKSLAAYRRDLIMSVKNNEVDEKLWKDYAQAVAEATDEDL
ncbi:MAG: hypothetical protein S4CHLAM6_05280 [Chlamydiae bacterium]|nr:hypothetical protein [Chlamydiota bacterium]